MNWENFQEQVVNIVISQDSDKVHYKPYAITYAENILAAIDEGYAMGIDTKSSVRTQLLYVLSNLEGAPESELRKINSIANECDIDVSEIICEILEGENV